MTPVLIAILGTLILGVLLKASEHALSLNKGRDVKELPPPPGGPTNAWLCHLWETRHKEAHPFKGDGNPLPIEDMSVCFDEQCANCMPTRDAIRQSDVERLRRLDDEQQRKTLELLAKSSNKNLRNDSYSERKRRGHRALEAKRLGKDRRVRIGHKSIPVPAVVPNNAKVTMTYNPLLMCDEVLYTWSEGITEMSYKDRVIDSSLEEITSPSQIAPIILMGDMNSDSIENIKAEFHKRNSNLRPMHYNVGRRPTYDMGQIEVSN